MVRDVGIGVQAKHLGGIVGRQTVDIIDESLQTLRARHLVALVELKGIGQQWFAEPHRGECGKQTLVKVIGHPTAVLDLTNHVDQGLPGDALLGIHLVQMVLDELNAGREVSLVKLVGYVPAQWTELAPLLDDGVEEGHRIEQRGPLGGRCVVEEVLGERLKRMEQPKEKKIEN